METEVPKVPPNGRRQHLGLRRRSGLDVPRGPSVARGSTGPPGWQRRSASLGLRCHAPAATEGAIERHQVRRPRQANPDQILLRRVHRAL